MREFAHSIYAKARNFAAPVSDEKSPGLVDEVHSAVLALAWIAAIASPFFVVLAIARGATAAVSVGAGLVATLGYLAVIVATRLPAEKRPEPASLLLSLGMIVVVFTLTAEHGLSATSFIHDAAYLSAVPLAFAVLAPWRPLYSAALGALTFAASSTALIALGASLSVLVVHVLYSLLFNGIGMGATQRARRRYVALAQARRGMVVADQMAQLGRMTAGIAHELKTPTAAVASSLTRALTLVTELSESIGHPGVEDDDLREIVSEMRESVELGDASIGRTARFIQTIREHTQSLEQAESVSFSPAQRLTFVERLLQHRVKNAPVDLEVIASEDIQMQGDPGKFEQIATNLVQNALDAIIESRVGTRVLCTIAQQGDRVFLRVSDDGPGVSPDIERRIFEPMFTTRGGSSGTGLGLAIARDLAASAFRGEITHQRPPSGGALFEANLSATGAPARQTRAFRPTFARTQKLRAA